MRSSAKKVRNRPKMRPSAIKLGTVDKDLKLAIINLFQLPTIMKRPIIETRAHTHAYMHTHKHLPHPSLLIIDTHTYMHAYTYIHINTFHTRLFC